MKNIRLCFFCGFSLFLFGSNENSLESYLVEHSVCITEGYMTEEQKVQFNERLNNYRGIKKILEIGLNAGHSAENFFKNCPDLELFASFDINSHSYTKHACNYLAQKYGSRFLFVEGDSAVTIPEFSERHPSLLFDLIYVDGCHSFEYALSDIFNARSLAHSETILWVDDFHDDAVRDALLSLKKHGIIKEFTVHYAPDRVWAEAQYSFSDFTPSLSFLLTDEGLLDSSLLESLLVKRPSSNCFWKGQTRKIND